MTGWWYGNTQMPHKIGIIISMLVIPRKEKTISYKFGATYGDMMYIHWIKNSWLCILKGCYLYLYILSKDRCMWFGIYVNFKYCIIFQNTFFQSRLRLFFSWIILQSWHVCTQFLSIYFAIIHSDCWNIICVCVCVCVCVCECVCVWLLEYFVCVCVCMFPSFFLLRT